MSLETWSSLNPHDPTVAEIQQLFEVVDRSLEDASKDVSPDLQFTVAYNAALQLCTIALYSEGFETRRRSGGHHSVTINSLVETLGESKRKTYVHLSRCSNLRHLIEYERVGVVSARDADELRQTTRKLRADVLDWLKRNHSDLIPDKLK